MVDARLEHLYGRTFGARRDRALLRNEQWHVRALSGERLQVGVVILVEAPDTCSIIRIAGVRLTMREDDGAVAEGLSARFGESAKRLCFVQARGIRALSTLLVDVPDWMSRPADYAVNRDVFADAFRSRFPGHGELIGHPRRGRLALEVVRVLTVFVARTRTVGPVAHRFDEGHRSEARD